MNNFSQKFRSGTLSRVSFLKALGFACPEAGELLCCTRQINTESRNVFQFEGADDRYSQIFLVGLCLLRQESSTFNVFYGHF